MQPAVDKTRPKAGHPQATPNPEVQKPQQIAPRIHFYAVHNAGEQLRWADFTRPDKKPDRMVGR